MKKAGRKISDTIKKFKAARADDDTEKVLAARRIAFFCGVPVVKVRLLKSSAFSCGVIFMGTSPAIGRTEVLHEYGHVLQLRMMGLPAYLIYVALPSLRGYWSRVPYSEYYSQPWEFAADLLGGAAEERKNYRYTPGACLDCYDYFSYVSRR